MNGRHRHRWRRAAAGAVVASLVVASCGDGDDGADVDAGATTTSAVTTTAAPATAAPTTATPTTAAPTTAAPTTVAPAGTGPFAAVPGGTSSLGLDPDAPPDGLTDGEAAMRATLLVLLDPDAPFADKAPYVEQSDRFESANDAFMQLLTALIGQIALTEPTYEIDGDQGTMRFSAEGPAIGEIRYELRANRVEDRWVFTLESVCGAVDVSSIPCP